LSVVEKIAESRASRGNNNRESAVRGCRDNLKVLAVHIVKQEGPLSVSHTPVVFIHARIHVPMRRKKVLPAVIVVVQEARAPAKERYSHVRDSREKAHVGEIG